MNVVRSEVTDEEFELVKPHFRIKTSALALPTYFQQIGNNWVLKRAKPMYKGGYDKSKYLKAIIDGEKYIIAAGNVITGIIADVLLAACQKYPQNFGCRDAHAVAQAIMDTRSVLGYNNLSEFEEFLSTEQFALVFKINSNGNLDKKVLRLDLYRLIKAEQNFPRGYEFIGGLFHALKHFRCQRLNLSTDIGQYDLNHPTDIVGMVIKGFFQSQHIYEKGKKYFKTLTPMPEFGCKTMHCSFFEEPIIDVYFLNTLFLA